MSGSSGGRADKLGNRYEGLWVAYQLLRLLAEEVASVQLEAIGDDEQGVDVWVTACDRTRDAQQCKRKNRTVGRWGTGELARQDVLKNLAAQLGRDASARFTFVSAHPAPELRELCDAARAAGGDPEAYFKNTLAVAAHAEHLRKFCQAVGASEHDLGDRWRAFDLLRRTFTHLFEDSPEGRGVVTLLARCLVTGNPETVVEVLANFAQDNLTKAISVEQVRSHLRDRGLPPARLAGNPLAAQQVERLRDEFRESLRPSLIHSALVPRPEAVAVLDLLNSQPERRLVVLHGRGGAGKSCVLLQLTELLERRGVPYLPLRLDRRTPQTSSLRYGTDVCGLPESPAVVLHALNPGRLTVLIVDQLDAVRWTAAHASAPWEACREVIDDALGLPGVAVVVACRTLDLKDDQQIHAWHSARKGQEVAVGDLSEGAVEAAVVAAGGNYAGLTSRQKVLLRSPLHLALWTQVVANGGTPGGWATHADLLRSFWRSRFDAAAKMGVLAAETRDAVNALVEEMDRREELAAPARTLDPFPKAAAALKSLHVVVEAGRQVTFAHQTYFEYQLAARLLDDAQGGGRSVLDWVRQGEQSLLRRDQLRLVLTLLRDEDASEYVRTVRGLVLAPPGDIRFHLRQLTLRVLGESPAPTAGEYDLACGLAETAGWRDHVLDQVFARQPAWLEAADDRGLLARWLASPDESLVETALLVCRFWSRQCGDRVAGLLAPHLDRPDPWVRRVAEVLPFDPADDTEPMFHVRLRLIRRGAFRHHHLLAKELSQRHPLRLIALLEAHLDRCHTEPDDAHDRPQSERRFPHHIPLHEAEHLYEVADILPRPFWERFVPLVVRACEASREESGAQPLPFFRDRTWCGPRWEFAPTGSVEFLRFVARAGCRLATANPQGFASENATLLNFPGLSVQRMVGLALAEAGDEAADLAIGWLSDNCNRLSLGDDGDRRWELAQRIIRRHAVGCSAAAYSRLERAILDYHEPEERRSMERHLREVREGYFDRPNCYGLAQHALLPCLPAHRLSVRARSEMGMLGQKFGRSMGDLDPAPPVRMGARVEPVPAAHFAGISDRGWLQIIGGRARPDRPRRAAGGRTRPGETAEACSRQLGLRARWEPGRFAKLALSIPEGANPAYLEAILGEVSHASPPSPEATGWIPATDQQITAVIEHVGYRADTRIGYTLCWLMRQRPQALSTPPCLETLRRYTTDHPDPTPGWSITADEVPDHETTAINCTRGVALGAVAQLLFARPDLLGEFVPALRRAAADDHPAVRVATVEACLAALNTDRDLAVELFLSACEGPDEQLGTRRVGEFLRHSLRSHHRHLEPLLRRMAESLAPDVATFGAAWLTFLSLGGRVTPESVAGYACGTAAQRKGVAMAAAQNCDDAALVVRCGELLEALIDDPDEAVREQAAQFLSEPSVLRSATGRRLAERFAAGLEFPRQPHSLVEALRRHPDSLVPLAPVFEAACGRVAADLTDAVRRGEHQRNQFELDRFAPLILRLYEQAEQARDAALRNRCLDWWDRLLQARMNGTIQLLGDLETGPGV
jgi:hypothetical protein